MDEYDAQVLLFAEVSAAETGATREARGGRGNEKGRRRRK
jgi:hypothetical protein